MTHDRLPPGVTLRLCPAAEDAATPPRPVGKVRLPGPPVVRCENFLYRAIEPARAAIFSQVFRRNVLGPLIEDGLVVETEAGPSPAGELTAVRQRVLPFATYPHEWCAPMLCQAARTLLDVSLRLARRGYALKNIRATTVQFDATSPMVVDVTSLAPLSGEPAWVGYPEFTAQFLYPLALMAHGREHLARQLLARGGLRTADVLAHLTRPHFPASLRAELKANSIIRRLLRKAWRTVHPAPPARRRPPGTRTRDAVVRHLELARDELEDLAPRLTARRAVPQLLLPRPRVCRLLDGLAPASTIDLTGGWALIGHGGRAALSFHDNADACAANYYAALRREREDRHLPLVIDPQNLPIARGPAPYERLKAEFVFVDAAQSGLLKPVPGELHAAVAGAACWTRRWLLVEMPPGVGSPPRPLLDELEHRFQSVTRLPSDLAAGGLLLCER